MAKLVGFLLFMVLTGLLHWCYLEAMWRSVKAGEEAEDISVRPS